MKATDGYFPLWYRTAEVILGLASVVISIVILANLSYAIAELVLLLSVALLFSATRMMASGGIGRSLASLRTLGLLGGGLLTFSMVLAVILLPGISTETIVFLLAISLGIQGFGRILHSVGRDYPRWLRESAIATGVVTVGLVVAAVLVPNLAMLTLVLILSVVVFFNGVEMIVSGLRPTNERQFVLLKLIMFAALYGLIIINWIDLFATSAPAYQVWLILTYMAPFGVLIVFQGFKDWQLAVSLGLLVSLMNDVGYFFVGDLLFGFKRALAPWVLGQLGFQGGTVLFVFKGGLFSFNVTSTLMGISIYARVAVVAAVLYHWWKSPMSDAESRPGSAPAFKVRV